MTMSETSIYAARGTLGVGPDGSFQIQFVRELPHTPQKVWRWLTEPDRLERWLPGCRIGGREGAAVHFDFGEEGSATGEVRSVAVPDHGTGHLEHTWVWEGVPTSVVTWQLEPLGGGTRLTLLHRELVEEPAREFALGWYMMLDSLQLDLDGRSTDSAWAAAEELAGNYLRP